MANRRLFENLGLPNITVQRYRITLAVLSVGLISGFLLSPKLWLTERTFPHLPVFGTLRSFPAPWDSVCMWGMGVCLFFLILYPRRILIIFLILCMLILAFQDQMRLQPWYYQYWLMLIPCALTAWPVHEGRAKSILRVQQIILIGVYLWGGLHKAHPGFIEMYVEVLMRPLIEAIENDSLIKMIKASAYIVPPFEVLLAIFLVFRRTRQMGVLMALATHLIIFMILGPLKGEYSNSIVWPWNLAMVGFLFSLFFRNSDTIAFKLSFDLRTLVSVLLSSVVIVAPLLFYVGKWDRYLSFNLYSARQRKLYVKIDPLTLPKTPPNWTDHFLKIPDPKGHKILSVSRWSLSELNVPLITEKRTLRAVCEEIATYDESGFGMLFLIEYPRMKHRGNALFYSRDIDSVEIP